MNNVFKNNNRDTEEHWISISDLMSALMMIFLLIAIVYMLHATKEKDKIREIAVTYQKIKISLYNSLYDEFKDDLDKWNAEIDKENLSIRFKAPEVLFEAGEATIKPRFQVILDDFFPRYINILTQYKNDIDEIRIEGHTSSEWQDFPPNEAYFANMNLSQKRTRTVLRYVLGLQSIADSPYFNWLMKDITANGLSSSKLIIENGTENKAKSRRVEFRVRTKAEERIVRILELEK